VLTPLPPAARGVFAPTNVLKRCPGTASQAPEDKSAPFTDDGRLRNDCDTSQVPPGP